ncbi:MAG: DUF4013 domain-containing protein [Eggerthellaceae bacterium]|nr:DUF4013 domain-containing protein [Eggerthellaceae bacterium]
MQIKYYQTAWNDIKNSKGWFGKLCLLALVGLIPIFGQIVIFGYLYGWARDVAWGVHELMPAKIFGNEDGKLYRRGWFIFVLVFVFSLVPAIISGVGSSMQQAGYYSALYDTSSKLEPTVAIGGIIYLIGILAALFVSILAWVGSMRISIYDRLSAGFQLGSIWKMFRKDTGGIMRIFGMNLLVGLILGIILSIIITIMVVAFIFIIVAAMAGMGYTPESLQYMSDEQVTSFALQLMGPAGLVGFLFLIVAVFLGNLVSVFVEMLVARAMGYWTWQFDVPQWRGQNEPMPFEYAQAQPNVQAYQQQPTAYAAPAQQDYQNVGYQQASQPVTAQPNQVGYAQPDAVQPAQPSISPEVQQYDAQISSWQQEQATFGETPKEG